MVLHTGGQYRYVVRTGGQRQWSAIVLYTGGQYRYVVRTGGRRQQSAMVLHTGGHWTLDSTDNRNMEREEKLKQPE